MKPKLTLADLKGAPKVPDRDAFADKVAAISQGLFDKLERALAAGAGLSELEDIRSAIERLGNEVRVAGLVLGLLAPFKPKRQRRGFIAFGSMFAGSAVKFTTSAAGIKTLFPWVQTAVDFLAAKKVIKASEFASLSMDAQQAAFTAPGMEDEGGLRKLRDEIAKGVGQEGGGESLAEFRKRIADQVALSRSQTETVFRTNVKQGYVSGFDKSMKSDLLEDLFPAVMFSATEDSRVRSTHWELDGFTCLKSDPAYKVLLRALKDWNCRCSPVPMTLEQAKQTTGGLRTIADLRQYYPDVMAKYGQGI